MYLLYCPYFYCIHNRRLGAKKTNPMGTKWQLIQGMIISINRVFRKNVFFRCKRYVYNTIDTVGCYWLPIANDQMLQLSADHAENPVCQYSFINYVFVLFLISFYIKKYMFLLGELVLISVGQAGVWGINSKNEVLIYMPALYLLTCHIFISYPNNKY